MHFYRYLTHLHPAGTEPIVYESLAEGHKSARTPYFFYKTEEGEVTYTRRPLTPRAPSRIIRVDQTPYFGIYEQAFGGEPVPHLPRTARRIPEPANDPIPNGPAEHFRIFEQAFGGPLDTSRKRPCENTEAELRAELSKEERRLHARSVSFDSAPATGNRPKKTKLMAYRKENGFELVPVDPPAPPALSASPAPTIMAAHGDPSGERLGRFSLTEIIKLVPVKAAKYLRNVPAYFWDEVRTVGMSSPCSCVCHLDLTISTGLLKMPNFIESQDDSDGHPRVKRFKPLPRDVISKPAPEEGYINGFKLEWTNDPTAHIGKTDIEKIRDLVKDFAKDIYHNDICREPHLVPGIVEYADRINVPLSAAINNFMVETDGGSSPDAWEETFIHMYHELEAAHKLIEDLYLDPEFFQQLKKWADISTGAMRLPEIGGLPNIRYNAGRAAAILNFLLEQSEKDCTLTPEMIAIPRMALMSIIVDLSALHKSEPMMSFCNVVGPTMDQRDPASARIGVFPRDDLFYRRAPLEMITPEDLKKAVATDYHQQTQIQRTVVARPAEGNAVAEVRPIRSILSSRQTQPPGRGSTKAKSVAFRSKIAEYQGGTPIRPPKYTRPNAVVIGPRRRTKLISRARCAQAVETPSVFSPMPQRVFDRGGISAHSARAPRESSTPHSSTNLFEGPGLPSWIKPPMVPSRAKMQERAAARIRAEEEQKKREEAARLSSGGLRRPTRPLITNLSHEWQQKVFAALAGTEHAKVAASPEGTPLTSKDFKTVVPPKEWLNDEIVNGTLLYLANSINAKAGIRDVKQETPLCHAFTSFFWPMLNKKGPAGMDRWMKRVGLDSKKFLNIETILIPICEGNHWTVVVVRPKLRTIAHMDSLGTKGAGRTQVTNIVLNWVRHVLGQNFTQDWRVLNYISPTQNNGYDCGVHVITNATHLALGLDPSCYEASDMPLQRLRLAATLLNGGYSGDFDLGGSTLR